MKCSCMRPNVWLTFFFLLSQQEMIRCLWIVFLSLYLQMEKKKNLSIFKFKLLHMDSSIEVFFGKFFEKWKKGSVKRAESCRWPAAEPVKKTSVERVIGGDHACFRSYPSFQGSCVLELIVFYQLWKNTQRLVHHRDIFRFWGDFFCLWNFPPEVSRQIYSHVEVE